MRKSILAAIISIASIAVPSTVLAQNSWLNTVSLDSWETIKFSYSSSTLELDNIYNVDDMDFNVFSFEYLSGYNIVDNQPIFLEWGVGAELMKNEDEESTYIDGTKVSVESKTSIVDFYIPINIGYKLAVNNNATIMPYVGLKAQLNIFAEESIKATAGAYSVSEDYDLFDQKDMGDNTLNHGLLSWHLGATVDMNNKWSLGVRYSSNITKEVLNDIDDCKLSSVTVSVGYFF